MIKLICENCGQEYYRRQRGSRFCSNKCRAQKIMPFRKPDFIPYNYDFSKPRICKNCGNKLGNGNKSGYCHNCYSKFIYTSDRRSKIAKLLYWAVV